MYRLGYITDFGELQKKPYAYPFSKANKDTQMDSNFYILILLPLLSSKLIWGGLVKKSYSKLNFLLREGITYRHSDKTVSLHCLKKKKRYIERRVLQTLFDKQLLPKVLCGKSRA